MPYDRDKGQQRAYNAIYHEANKRVARDRFLQRTYGISLAEYEAMLLAQDGRCASCGGPPCGPGRAGKVLHVDHHHVEGHVRGLLCSKCNTALGLLNDSPSKIAALLAYAQA